MSTTPSIMPTDRRYLTRSGLHRLAIALTVGAGVTQVVWFLLTDGTMAIANAVVAAGCLVAAATGARVRLINILTRVLLGLAFLGSVADRLGLLGAPASAGVTWGEFDRFVEYTGSLLPWLPTGVTPAVAALATAVEILLGVALIVGVRARWSATLVAGVLATFAAAMVTSLGFAAMSEYGVLVLVGGALVLATAPPKGRGRTWSRRSTSDPDGGLDVKA